MEENSEYLTTQIITYLGNKRALLGFIESEIRFICGELKKERLVCADLFSGSGIVSRMLKKYSSVLISNDQELYSSVINKCYLCNKTDFPQQKYKELKNLIEQKCKNQKIEGIIAKNYAPKDDLNIQKGERVFYTRENALLIDTYRFLIDELIQEENLKPFFIAPLLTESSVHVNTSGVFKGFYKDKNTGIGCFGAAGKNALSRIKGKIILKEPVLSNFESEIQLYKEDSVILSSKLKNIDVTYLDPPYNQHPYGSNYFMLNVIAQNKLDVPISRVSGIAQNWNRSAFNKNKTALESLEQIIKNIESLFVIISYNSEGFISFNQMKEMLLKYGTVKTVEVPYNTFRGSRNLNNRSLKVSEFLFVLKKS